MSQLPQEPVPSSSDYNGLPTSATSGPMTSGQTRIVVYQPPTPIVSVDSVVNEAANGIMILGVGSDPTQKQTPITVGDYAPFAITPSGALQTTIVSVSGEDQIATIHHEIVFMQFELLLGLIFAGIFLKRHWN